MQGDINTVYNAKCFEWISSEGISYTAIFSCSIGHWRLICAAWGGYLVYSAGKCIPAGHKFCSARFQAFNLFISLGCINQFACATAFVNFLLSLPALSALFGFIYSVILAVQWSKTWLGSTGAPQLSLLSALVLCGVYASSHDVSPPGIQRARCSAWWSGACYPVKTRRCTQTLGENWQNMTYRQVAGDEGSLCRLQSMSTEHLWHAETAPAWWEISPSAHICVSKVLSTDKGGGRWSRAARQCGGEGMAKGRARGRAVWFMRLDVKNTVLFLRLILLHWLLLESKETFFCLGKHCICSNCSIETIW